MRLIKTQHNRRSFLKITSAASGGMLIGFSWFTGCKPDSSDPVKEMVAVPNEWFDINGYIKIGDTGMVTIYSPNPEIGQNVMTSMPMIVAEELDVNWDHVVVEQGPLDKNEFKNPQFAGGSLSIKLGWDALRMAGATGRRMLLEAAAKEWEVKVEDLSVSEGIISEKNGTRTISYGDIASKAVAIEVPDEVELKDPKDFKLIGTSQKNVEGSKIVTGKPLFGIDFKREGMLLAMIEHPPAFGMTVKDFNEAEIKAMDGIKDAFIIDTNYGEVGRFEKTAFHKLIAIVGDSTWQLMQAKKALKANWETKGDLENSEMHAQQLVRDIEKGEVQETRKDGDTDAAFAKAVKVIERTYTAPFQAHNTMEPMNFFADVKADKAELIGPVQTPKALREGASKMLGISEDNIIVDMTRMGGGFGRRLYVHFGLEAAAISKKVGKPIKLIYSREDDMTYGIYRPAYRSTYKAGIDKNNNIIAYAAKGVGFREGAIWPNRFPAGTIDNYEATKLKSETNVSMGAWRAPRSHFAAGAEQSFLDELAELTGKDPIDLQLELFERAKKKPVGEENDYEADRYAGVIKMVKEKANWGVEKTGVFRGFAAYYCHSTYVAQIIDLVMKDDEPVVKKVWCAVDCGIVVNKDAAKNIIEGGVVDGIGHAMYSEIQFKDGASNHNNFNSYQLIRHHQAPKEIEVHFVENGIKPTGLGEPGLPPAVGALANALYKATGKRYYHQPFDTKEQKQYNAEGLLG